MQTFKFFLLDGLRNDLLFYLSSMISGPYSIEILGRL